MTSLRLLPLIALALLAGCDPLGTEAAEKTAALKEADGKAIGSACRHAGRAIEDCYALNAKAQRAAVFAGWREMDEYMRENKLEAVAPQIQRPGSKPVESEVAKTEAVAPIPAEPKADKRKSHTS